MNEENIKNCDCVCFGKRIRRVYRKVDWWFDRHLWFWIGIKTQQSGNKFLAGVHEFAWSKYCGYGWSFAWRMGYIYWRPTL